MWESEFDNIVSKEVKVQEININQLELEVHDSYEKENTKTVFEPISSENVMNKAYTDENLIKINGHFVIIRKRIQRIQIQYNKQSLEEILFQRAVKTTIQIVYDKSLFDNFPNAEKVLEDFLSITRRRADLEEIIDNDVQ